LRAPPAASATAHDAAATAASMSSQDASVCSSFCTADAASIGAGAQGDVDRRRLLVEDEDFLPQFFVRDVEVSNASPLYVSTSFFSASERRAFEASSR